MIKEIGRSQFGEWAAAPKWEQAAKQVRLTRWERTIMATEEAGANRIGWKEREVQSASPPSAQLVLLAERKRSAATQSNGTRKGVNEIWFASEVVRQESQLEKFWSYFLNLGPPHLKGKFGRLNPHTKERMHGYISWIPLFHAFEMHTKQQAEALVLCVFPALLLLPYYPAIWKGDVPEMDKWCVYPLKGALE